MLSLEKTKSLLELLLSYGVIDESTKEDKFESVSIADIETTISIIYPEKIADSLFVEINKIVSNEDKYTPIINIINKQVVNRSFEKEKANLIENASNDFMVNSKTYGKKSGENLIKQEKNRNDKIAKHSQKIKEYKEDVKKLKKKNVELKHLK